MCAGAGGEVTDAQVAKADNGNGRTSEKKTAEKDVSHGAEAVDRRTFVFGRRRVGVARRPSAMVDAGGVTGAAGASWWCMLVRLVRWRQRRRRWWRRRWTPPCPLLSQK